MCMACKHGRLLPRILHKSRLCNNLPLNSDRCVQGQSMCVWPANTAACYLGFYTTAASLGSCRGTFCKNFPKISDRCVQGQSMCVWPANTGPATLDSTPRPLPGQLLGTFCYNLPLLNSDRCVQGQSMCVWPANTAACYPGFYTTAALPGQL